MVREPFVSAIYNPDEDAAHHVPENFTNHVRSIVSKAQAVRRRKRQYGSYASRGAQATPESTRLTRRIAGEKDD